MIKIENVEVGGLKPALRGMRNPKNSWARSDSGLGCTHRKNWNKEEDGLLLCENCGHTYEEKSALFTGRYIKGQICAFRS